MAGSPAGLVSVAGEESLAVPRSSPCTNSSAAGDRHQGPNPAHETGARDAHQGWHTCLRWQSGKGTSKAPSALVTAETWRNINYRAPIL